MKDLYYILGQDINATPGELNAAYRKLAKKLRPGGQEADPFLENHFSEIIEAYQVLSDPDKRRKYDAALRKSQKRRLYWFKLSYLTVVAVLTLVGFTALFGYYVIRMINGTKTRSVTVAKAETAEIIQPKHHKRKHKLTSTIAAAPAVMDKPVVIATAPVIKKDSAIAKITRSVAAPQIVKAPVIVKQPAVVNSASFVPANNPVIAYLQANTTGVVSLHQLASYQSAVITYIPNHSQVQVLEKGPGFCKVTFQNQTGYVPKWTVPE